MSVAVLVVHYVIIQVGFEWCRVEGVGFKKELREAHGVSQSVLNDTP